MLVSRVPPPPMEVDYVRVQHGPATRWAKYVAPSGSHIATRSERKVRVKFVS